MEPNSKRVPAVYGVEALALVLWRARKRSGALLLCPARALAELFLLSGAVSSRFEPSRKYRKISQKTRRFRRVQRSWKLFDFWLWKVQLDLDAFCFGLGSAGCLKPEAFGVRSVQA